MKVLVKEAATVRIRAAMLKQGINYAFKEIDTFSLTINSFTSGKPTITKPSHLMYCY
jgi:hypothetical protein